ncbi:MAG TPA: roadblock/LC7 domain-containing protein [Thermoplasmata archaeon]|nr:roadblock/LC7 domain-containing protein [Thermoplasmata archaeon]
MGPGNRADRVLEETRRTMADQPALESILKEIEAIEGVHSAVLVGRSGQYLAGTIPEGATPDTFVAMFAILVGAAETASSELKEQLDTVILTMEASKIVVVNDGPKAIFVLRTRKDADLGRIKTHLERFSRRIEEHL